MAIDVAVKRNVIMYYYTTNSRTKVKYFFHRMTKAALCGAKKIKKNLYNGLNR